ncbi:MAG: CocE/NonD family hydrolase [Candidatus Dormibacteria bacterium]
MNLSFVRPLGVAGVILAGSLGVSPAVHAGYSYTRGTITSVAGELPTETTTPIVYNLYLPDSASSANPVPLILRGHGWGGSGETPATLSSTAQALLANGYAVLTWDSRGFGQSGGEAEVDSPQYERVDASRLIDFAATLPSIKQDSLGPIVGMTGGSYAGGIQLVTAAFDPRVRAIVPEITWNDLRYSLFPQDVTKLGWTQLLFGSGLTGAGGDGVTCAAPPPGSCEAGIQAGTYSQNIYASEATGLAEGAPDAATKAFFAHNSLASGYDAGKSVSVPTMLLQGNVDTLFNLKDAYRNYLAITATGAPAKMVAFCGGHVACPFSTTGTREYMDNLILTWFDRYLNGNTRANTGSNFEYETQDAVFHSLDTWPTPADPGAATYVDASGSGIVVATPAPTSGVPSAASYLPAVVDGPSTANDPGTLTVNVLTAGANGTTVVGVPHVTGSVTGAGNGAHLFFKLVDRETGIVLDYQAESLRITDAITPLSAALFDLDLAGVSYAVPSGHHVDLQVATSSFAHVGYRGAGVYTVNVGVQVPTIG